MPTLARSLAVLALAAAPVSPAVRPPFRDPSRAVEAALARAPAGGPRAAAATTPLVGAPYASSPLGEGEGPDPDPRFRLDAFDCMTFVETAVALGSAATLDEARRALDDVRYSGPPALAARNHEVLSQWIPRALAKGLVRDVTRALAGDGARRIEETYSRASWRLVRRAGRGIAGVPAALLPSGAFELWIAPAELAPALASEIPDGTIVFVVRAHEEARATRITHAGLVVVRAGGARVVRHATSSRGVARVIEEPLERFVARQQKAYPRWRVEGLALLEIADATARVRGLPDAVPMPAPARPPGSPPGAPAPAPAAAAQL